MNWARQQHPLADPVVEATRDSFASITVTVFENIIAVP